MAPSASGLRGPFPRADRNAELQRLSIKALQNTLPSDRFVFRDERQDDVGADASLELIISGGYTNIRAQVQLKATDSTHTNADGSVSLSVPTSNLNYLINGPSPLYVLYIEPRKELRVLWAHDVYRRLETENPDWSEQATVTLRFERLLTPDVMEEVYVRVRREGQPRRQTTDLLAQAGSTEQLCITIDPVTLDSITSVEAENALLASGISIVSSGFAAKVIDLSEMLPAASARNPRIQLVRAYAEYLLSKTQQAFARTSEVLISAEKLSVSDRDFLKFLRDACEFHLGKLDLQEYARREDTWHHQPGSLYAVAYRLQYLRQVIGEVDDLCHRTVLSNELVELAGETEARTDLSDVFKLQTRIIALQEEGRRLVEEFSDQVRLCRLRGTFGRSPQLEDPIQHFVQEWDRWEERIQAALQGGITQAHPLLTAEALSARAAVRAMCLATCKLIMLTDRIPEVVPGSLRYPAMADAEKAMEIYVCAGQLEGELIAKIILGELFDLEGQQRAAQALAGDVCPKAQAMGYRDLVRRAQALLSGQTPLREFEAHLRQSETSDDDPRLTRMGDEALRQCARRTLQALDLPDDRLPVVERDWEALRAAAQERLDWCGHLQLIQDLGHEDHPSTHYRQDPKRYCRCEIHAYGSQEGLADWREVIIAFKQLYCSRCSDRCPKRPEAGV